MKIWLVALVTVLLGGCAGEVVHVAKPIEVKIPVPVRCVIKAPVRPAWAVDALDLHAGIYRQMQSLRAERHQRVGYERELESAINACQ